MSSPYENRPRESFWKSAVADRTLTTLSGLYRPGFRIGPQTRVATAGSCFAQHVARNLRARGFTVVDTEPAPCGLAGLEAERFGFCLFSARYGNIYVVRHLRQLFDEAFGEWRPEDAIWERDGRYFDALRPSVEPDGHASPEGVIRHRARHLAAVRTMFQQAEVLVFTLGLTETWMHRASGTVYPTAPGTIAGSYDPAIHEFHNFTAREIHDDFVEFRANARHANPNLRFLLTVSPVPLTATATNQHVLVATTYSKAVLRAVAGELSDEFDDIAYFPAYEIVTSPLSRGVFYASNLRSVTPLGVDTVMRAFFAAHRGASPSPATSTVTKETPRARGIEDDVSCDEVLLEAFGR